MPKLLDGDFKELFKKPPEDVIAFFKEKGNRGPDDHWDWSDTMRHAHDRAFTVSKATSLDILRDIRGSLAQAIEQGQGYKSWAKSITPTLQAKGWWGKKMVINPQTGEEKLSQLGSQRRLETIYNENMSSAYQAGQHAKQMEVVDVMPYWWYIARAPGKNRRPDHQALNGIVKRWDDPFWTTHKPKNAFGCQCESQSMDASDVEREFGKPVDQVVTVSKPEDFNTKTVEVQGKQVQVVGFKVGKEFVYPYPGFDYSPGDAAWRSKQILADKIVDLPPGKTREAFDGHLRKGMQENFKQYLSVVRDTGATRGEFLPVGILSESDAASVAAKSIRTKAGTDRLNTLGTPLLLAEDKQLLHALRDYKLTSGIAMPQELLSDLPALLETYSIRWDKQKAGLLFYSDPFREKGKLWRWKAVFEPKFYPNGNRMVFKTVTKVGADDIGKAGLL